jgi:hypothetical protein
MSRFKRHRVSARFAVGNSAVTDLPAGRERCDDDSRSIPG